ncbi:hypothetical protein [Desulfonatronum sp. SC1]|uniref:hypothetical protein n=1 Tax=Desulfonatronum sp. SC1 TaxID=2109626 RepID=UPI000D31B19B|nr:hypothetical protein [Desulfonatronum sp. SC1]PTN37582.1 hypothetical protein C6366_06425 [Desulfonatronum sp. SC1]
MKKLSLVKDDGEIREYRLNDGRLVTIDVSDDSELVVKDHKNNEIGKMNFSYRDEDFPGGSSYYHITWMYLDLKDSSYLHKGIGREALTHFKEVYGLPIKASDNDGLKKDDGSHLTGDAPTFVEKMRNEGLIEPVFR